MPRKMELPVFFFICLVTVVASGSAALRQSFLREPFDQIATVGEHVTLPCRVSKRQGVLQWTRDDFGLGSDRELDGFKRYTMTGSDEEGKKIAGIIEETPTFTF